MTRKSGQGNDEMHGATDVDVIIAGAGPTGLMLAGELGLAGVRPLVLERQPQRRDTQKANGLGGQVLRLLRLRGLLDRFEAASTGPLHPAPRYPFGDVHLDFSGMADPPLQGLHLPQPRLERLLEEHAEEVGAEVRRGHELLGVDREDGRVAARVNGPDGPYRVTARYLVGCDGPRSRVREEAGISFPGTTYPEINRLAQITLPDAVTLLDDGDLQVPGLGVLHAGFTRTEQGLFGIGSLGQGVWLVLTTEDEPVDRDDRTSMTPDEFRDSVRRVLGADLPVQEWIRLSRYRHQARQADRYRDRRILVAGDAAHLFPATGVGLNAGMLDAANLAWKLAARLHGWAPAGLLDTYQEERRLAAARTMLHTQAQVALRRGTDPAAEALREVFLEVFADEQPLRRVGALIAGADVRYPQPGAGVHPLTGAFVPTLAPHPTPLLGPARPVLLDLAGRPEVRAAAGDWASRVDVRTAETADRPADALLIRPDGHVAWATAVDEPAEVAVPALREALGHWFGAPPVTEG
ncbi:FAD-dependent monooxygenase [Streptomyces sp. NPDC002454]